MLVHVQPRRASCESIIAQWTALAAQPALLNTLSRLAAARTPALFDVRFALEEAFAEALDQTRQRHKFKYYRPTTLPGAVRIALGTAGLLSSKELDFTQQFYHLMSDALHARPESPNSIVCTDVMEDIVWYLVYIVGLRLEHPIPRQFTTREATTQMSSDPSHARTFVDALLAGDYRHAVLTELNNATGEPSVSVVNATASKVEESFLALDSDEPPAHAYACNSSRAAAHEGIENRPLT